MSGRSSRLSPNRIFKKLARSMMVSWRKQPTRFDIEALQANISRVGLVIRVRWVLVAVLGVYSVLAVGVYAFNTPLSEVLPNMLVPAGAMVFVLLYNTYYSVTYRRLGNIAILNHAQLMFDALVVTLLVYYSGGVHSWFWAMYSLFILEAAFILPKRWHAYQLAVVSAAMIAVVVWGEYAGLIPHRQIPFTGTNLYDDLTYVSVRFLWQLTVLIGTATVSTLMMSKIRTREAELAAASIIDDKTGLYDRAYFNRMISSELLRAGRDERNVHLVLLDLDGFGRFNQILGIDNGDAILCRIAEALQDVALRPRGVQVATNVVCRYGGEEFAIILSGSEGNESEGLSVEEAAGFAEIARRAVEQVRVRDAGVTASVGVASFPTDGDTVEELLLAADEAVHAALMAGGNRVVVASQR